MFEDTNGQNPESATVSSPAATAARPQEQALRPASMPRPLPAEDIFQEVEPQDKPAVFQRKASGFDEVPSAEEEHQSHQKIFVFIFFILMIMLLGAGSAWAYRYFVKRIGSSNSIVPEQSATENVPVVPATSGTPTVEENIPLVPDTGSDTVLPPETATEQATDTATQEDVLATADSATTDEANLDSDGDGLLDEEEWRLGTAVDNVDTDNDGLFDRDEVKIYKTNPKLADTDNDGFADGAEVKAGYNPLGSGKLYDIK